VHSLRPLTALGGSSPQQDRIGALTIVETPDVALASVAARLGQEAVCRKALGGALGAAVPEPGKALLVDPVSALWMGPDQWLLWARHQSHELLADGIKTELGAAASVTEQNDAWVCFDVSGPSVVDLSERLCAAPARRMRTGDAQRTAIHHMGCFLIVLEAGQEFRFVAPRSSAGSFHHALVTAARSVA
jgi:sarcosine oxidase subunit gamma